MKTFFIRHGMTYGNTKHQYIGRTDQPLCEEGREAIIAVKERGIYPQINKVYVSPKKRARETAQILFPEAEQIVIEDLREMDFGVFEERSYIDMADDQIYQDWVAGKCEGQIPGGELKSAFTERSCKAFLELIKTLNEEDSPIVFAVHGGTIMSILSSFAVPVREYYDFYVKNGYGYECDWDGKALTILKEFGVDPSWKTPEEG